MTKLFKCSVVVRYCSDEICHIKIYNRKNVSFVSDFETIEIVIQYVFKRQLFVTVIGYFIT
jgi:hypothetical protein